MNFLRAFERTVRVHADDTALVTDDEGPKTYAEFDRRSTKLAKASFDRVGDAPLAILTRNTSAAAEAMITGHKRGSPTVQLPFREKSDEITSMLDVADAEILVFDDANTDTALQVLDEGPVELGIHAGDRHVDVPEVESYSDVLAETPTTMPPELPRDGAAGVFYTSGTTKEPKAVAFNSEQLWNGAYQVVMEHGIDHTDRAIVTTPWYHMATTDAWLYPHWLAGATTFLHVDFDPENVLGQIEDCAVTGLLAVPTQLSILTETQATADTPFDTNSLEYIRSTGAMLPEALVSRTRKLLSEKLYNSYGLTEGGPNLTFAHPSAQTDHPGTIGNESFSWDVRVVEMVPFASVPDPEATVGPGGQGEIIARGPGVPDGCFRIGYGCEWNHFDDANIPGE